METAIIYTSGIPKGSWRWQNPTNVYVLIGPEDEVRRVKTINSVGSSRCPNVEARYFGWGDSRYDGPRSKYGKLLRKAERWIEKNGYSLAIKRLDLG